LGKYVEEVLTLASVEGTAENKVKRKGRLSLTEMSVERNGD
jgi:hypothetical protein